MGFLNERMRTGQLVNWFLLDGLELTPAGNPITKPQALPFGVDHLIGFNELLTCRHPENAGVHFFLDDYQFERFWRQPQKYLNALESFPLVIGPDFSLYTDFPAPLQRWNHYRNQLLTAWLQQQGVEKLIQQTAPSEILVYGKTPPAMAALLRERSIPWQAFPHNMAARVRPGEEAQ